MEQCKKCGYDKIYKEGLCCVDYWHEHKLNRNTRKRKQFLYLKIEDVELDVEEIKKVAGEYNDFTDTLNGKYSDLSILVGAMVYAKGNEFAMLEVGLKKASLEDLRRYISDIVFEQRSASRMGDLK